jgi:hypothetical protein
MPTGGGVEIWTGKECPNRLCQEYSCPTPNVGSGEVGYFPSSYVASIEQSSAKEPQIKEVASAVSSTSTNDVNLVCPKQLN